MVKLFSLSVIYKDNSKGIVLKQANNLDSFGFFQKTSVQEFMSFTSQILVERTPSGTRSSVREQDYLCHVYVRSDNLGGVVISDNEYPHRVAHTLLNKILDEFTAKVPRAKWVAGVDEGLQCQEYFHNPSKIQHCQLQQLCSRDPKQADAMTKIQADLDETKIILHNTIEAVLERGEKLDDLVAKSDELSVQSKAFYKTAKKTNSCCKVL